MAPFLFTGMEPGGFPDDGQSLTGSDSTAMCCCTEFPNSVSGLDQENRLLAGMLCKYRALSRMQFAFPDICGSSELREPSARRFWNRRTTFPWNGLSDVLRRDMAGTNRDILWKVV